MFAALVAKRVSRPSGRWCSLYRLHLFTGRSRLSTFTNNGGRLDKLAVEADRFPADSQKQAEYFDALFNNGQYWKIIERFEGANSNLAMDSRCSRLYVEAINKAGQGERLYQNILNGRLSSTSSSSTSSSPNASRSFQPKLFSGNNSHARMQSGFGGVGSSGPGGGPMRSKFQSEGPKGGSNNPSNGFGGPENPLYVVSKAPTVTAKDRFWTLVKVSVGLWLSVALFSTLSEELSRGNSRNFSVFSEVNPEDSSPYSFKDVAGVDEAKDELQEIVEFLRDPGKFTRLGGKLPKGVLLTGPPGNGKTLLARAIAGEAGVPFFLCSGSEFDEMFVGVGAKRVRELFAAAKKHSPCIIFIDEIDAVGSMRNPRDQQYAKMTLNQLLVEMDGFNQNQGIIVIGATNFPESLDKALVRPGRFDRTIDVSLPDVNGRLAILKVHTTNVPISKDVKLDIIARGCPGFSGADLANLVNHAALKAAAANKSFVTMKEFEWAKDRIIMGAEKKQSVLSAENRRMVAFHEAGHAVMAMFTPGAMVIHKATIMPRGSALGLVAQLPEKDEMNWTRKQLLARLDVAMGGRCAEAMIFGEENITSGASSDIESATRTARYMITRVGMGSNAVGQVSLPKEDYASLSSETRAVVEQEVRNMIENSYKRSEALLKSKEKELYLLAEALLEYETLSKDEIEIIVAGGKLERPVIDDVDNSRRPRTESRVKKAQTPLPLTQT